VAHSDSSSALRTTFGLDAMSCTDLQDDQF
jgi:hypothetical protein